jgi:hypothetical protein
MSEQIARATLAPITKKGKEETRGPEVSVHFNPASLQYTVSNTLKEEGSGNTKKQFVSQSTGKLTMDLVFDTTLDGQDVRTFTERLVKFMEPIRGGKGGGKKAPPVVEFRWGTYAFRGMVESYKETIDFFAPNGVPLRASVNLTLSRQDKVFEPTTRSKFDEPPGELATVEVPIAPGNVPGPRKPLSGGGQYATRLAAMAGDARAGRLIAALNGEESMRFSSGGALTVSAAIELGPPVAFSSGEAGVSGAFAGLRAPTPPRIALDLDQLVPRAETPSLGVDDAAPFSLGGQAGIRGAASLGADVGQATSLREQIRFEGD